MSYSYVSAGEGQPLLLLHGYLSSKESFYPQIEYFSRFFRVLAPDFPGMGRAEELPAAWSVGDYADWTEGFLRDMGAENPLLIAHSFGGRVGVKLLARGEVCRAVLVGCAGIVPRRTLSYKFRVASYRLAKKVFPRWAEKKFGSAEYRSLPPVMRESYKKIVNEDLREEAAAVSRPVLFVCGERDGETPPSSAREYHARVRGSKLLILGGCGHFAHLDDPLSFNLAAEEFFTC